MKNQIFYMLDMGKAPFCFACVRPSSHHGNRAFEEEKLRKPDAHHTFYLLHAYCLKWWKHDNEKKKKK